MKSKKKNALNSNQTDRRVALVERRRVAEMTVEEMRRELLTSQVTGLPNRRAFDEAGPTPVVAMCDMDGLKALNKYGYDIGNAVLLAMAHALCEVGLEAYHDKGDEFLCRARDIEELATKLDSAKTILREHTVLVQRCDGRTLNITGADFSYGAGKDLDEAESTLGSHRVERERGGDIARGELRSIIVNFTKAKDLTAGLRTACAIVRTALDPSQTKPASSVLLP